MSLLGAILSPFFKDFWIGRTFLHKAGTPGPADTPLPAGIELRVLCPEDIEVFRESKDPGLGRRNLTFSSGSRRFGAFVNGELGSICTYSFGSDYLQAEGFFALASRDAELIDIFTAPPHRGRGLAGLLIRYSAEQMHREGFETLFAKVWHSNIPSVRAFQTASWTESCFFIRLWPKRSGRVWHMEWRRP